MSTMSIGGEPKDPCRGNIEDQCWIVTVDGVNDGIDDIVCWSVSVDFDETADRDNRECWAVYGSNNCEQGDPSHFNRDIKHDKHDIFKIFAVHINYNEIFMAVQMREPDDPATQTYRDDWASATERIGDNAWIYRPTYKATEIVRVFDIFGDLPYWEGEDEYGYKYIVRDEMDTNFSVIYKIDMGYRIIRGDFSTSWDIQGHYMSRITGALNDLPKELIEGGDECFLMGREEFTFEPTIVFKGANKQNYLLEIKPFGELGLKPLASVGLNYMLYKNIAMNHKSKSYYYVDRDYGVGDVFINDWKKQEDVYKYSEMNALMLVGYDDPNYGGDGIYVGFPKWTTGDPKMVAVGNLVYAFYHITQCGGWTGVGETGYVVDIPCVPEHKYFSVSIGKPPNGVDVTGDSLCGSYPTRMGDFISFCGNNVFMGVSGDFPPINKFDYGYTPQVTNTQPKPNKVRIDARESSTNQNDLFVVFDTHLVWIRFNGNSYHYYMQGDFDFIPLCLSSEVKDFCYHNGQIIVANGTDTLKVYNVDTIIV